MSTHPRHLPSKDSIRAQLKEIGYANVPDEVLDEFMVDLSKLHEKQSTPSSSSAPSSSTAPSSSEYGWSTEESDYERRSAGRNTRVENAGGRNTNAGGRSAWAENAGGNVGYSKVHRDPHYDERRRGGERERSARTVENAGHGRAYSEPRYESAQEYSDEYQYQYQYPSHPSHHDVHNPPRSTHHYPPPYHHHTPHHAAHHHHAAHTPSYRSESEYETETTDDGVYDGEAYMPSHGIHISPHQKSDYSTHTSSDEKENYYRNNQDYHTRAHGPAHAPAARKAYAAPRHQRQPVYESDYSSAANEEYTSGEDPYYREAPYPYYTGASRPYKHTNHDEYYYSEGDTASQTSEMSNGSRYPGVKPNSSGVIWARKAEAGRAIVKSDPVSRYQELQRTWSQDHFLRSQSSNKNPKVNIPYEPPWKPPRKDLSLMRPDYVVPTEKRRDTLRFNVRAKMMS